jgi:mRNA interferase RelE/StbE
MAEFYTVFITSTVKKMLAKLPNKTAESLEESMLALEHNPRPHGSVKLKARIGYRIRVGDYRYIYTIEDKILKVIVVDVGHRKEVYK